MAKELERVKTRQQLLSRGLSQSEMYLEEAKQQVFEQLKTQAQEFIDSELLKRDAARQAEMQAAFDQRLAEALAEKMMLSPNKHMTNVEMKQGTPDKNDESRIGRGLNGRMGTRKHPVAFGKVDQPNYIRNMSEMSYEDENTLNRH